MARRALLLTVLSVMAVTPRVWTAPPEKESSPQANEVRSRMKDLLAALASGDADKVASMWTTSGEYVRDDLVIQGRENIQKAYTEHFKEKRKGKPRVVRSSVRTLAANLAIFEASVVVQHENPADNVRVHLQATLVKTDGTWLIGMLQETVAHTSVEEFDWMVGTWSFNAGEGQGTMDVRFTEKRTFLIIRTKTKKEDDERVAVQVLGVNPATGGIKSWSFESDGSVGTAQWVRTEKGWLAKVTSTSSAGEAVKAVTTIAPKNQNEFTFQVKERTIDGEKIPDTAATVVKRVEGSANTK